MSLGTVDKQVIILYGKKRLTVRAAALLSLLAIQARAGSILGADQLHGLSTAHEDSESCLCDLDLVLACLTVVDFTNLCHSLTSHNLALRICLQPFESIGCVGGALDNR
jgi:hypothetical protein